LETMGLYLKDAGSLFPAATASHTRIGADFKDRTNGSYLHMMSRILMTSYAPIAQSLHEDETRGRMVGLALDLSAHRQGHSRYPDSLAGLPEADKLPRDPFTAKEVDGKVVEEPFHYRLTPEGFMLWSVGPDGDDDGGKEPAEIGESVDLADDGDIVLRVPPKPRESPAPEAPKEDTSVEKP